MFQCYRYSVITHHEIFGTIIPFFNEHQLQSETKKRSFKIFCEIANIVNSGLHHKEEGITKIRVLKVEMNKKVIRQYKSSFREGISDSRSARNSHATWEREVT